MDRYAGQFVAYRLDGSAILVGTVRQEELVGQLSALGLEPWEVIFGYVNGPDDLRGQQKFTLANPRKQ